MLNGYISLNQFLEKTDTEITPVIIGEGDVLDIFSKTEASQTETEYGYTEVKGINTKPSLIASGEGLKHYSLPIKLHASYCRPDKIISELEDKASKREVVDYFQEDSYIGKYVINKISKNILSTYLGYTICAELNVDLVEYYEEPEDFAPQKKVVKNPGQDLKSVLKKKLNPAVKVNTTTQSQSFFSSLTDAALDAAIRQGKSYLSEKTNGVSDDIVSAI